MNAIKKNISRILRNSGVNDFDIVDNGNELSIVFKCYRKLTHVILEQIEKILKRTQTATYCIFRQTESVSLDHGAWQYAILSIIGKGILLSTLP